jgi:hypothetical protein
MSLYVTGEARIPNECLNGLNFASKQMNKCNVLLFTWPLGLVLVALLKSVELVWELCIPNYNESAKLRDIPN